MTTTTAVTPAPEVRVVSMDVPSDYRVGEWVVGRLVASGQYGTVYAANRADADRTSSTPTHVVSDERPDRVAIKFTRSLTEQGRRGLHLCMERDRAIREREEQPWAIRVLELLEVRDNHLPRLNGATAVVMELAECNLQELMGIPGVNVERLLVDTCRAMAGMHEFIAGQGSIFHGDLKPSNVLVLEDGTVRIGDLDLIQATEGTHLDASLDRPGTHDFLPPESFDGDPLIRATHDVWAFGIMAHQLLSGGLHPFPLECGSRAKALKAYSEGRHKLVLDDNLQRFPKVWAEVIRDCLQPDRTKRREITPAVLAERLTKGSSGARQSPARMPRRPIAAPPGRSVGDLEIREAIKPRPVRRRVGILTVTLGCLLSLLVGGSVGAATYQYTQPDVPTMVPDKAAYGRVQSNSGFGGRDLCSKYRTFGAFQYKSCVHHSEGSFYGGMVIRSASDATQRVEATWADYVLPTTGGRPTMDSQWKQEVIVGPGDTVTVLTTPKVERETRCVGSSGYLFTNMVKSTQIVRSPFENFTPTPCPLPAGWDLATADEPAPAAVGTVIPGGFVGTDCSGSWSEGPAGTGVQYQACLYHRVDNPNLWNGGVLVRNISKNKSPAMTFRIRLESVTSGKPDHTTIADQELAIPALGPTNPYSIAAPYQRWPSQETGICLLFETWPASNPAGESVASRAPFRNQTGGTCSI